MQWNPDRYSQFKKDATESDYAHPDYYQQDILSRSARPVEPLETEQVYREYPYGDGGQTQTKEDPLVMSEYRGPANLEGYTVDAGTEQRDAAQNGKVGSDGSSGKKKGLAGLGGLGAIVAALLKLQWLAYLLKFGFAGFSAIISIVLYSYLFGWPFAVGLVALLFLHEMGHAIVMKIKGIPVGGMIFIPMLGAAVFMRQMPKNAKDEAEVGIAGPIAGAIASSICLLIALQAPHVRSIWAPLAYFGFFMNLFNLIPIVPFDGGRVVAALDRRMWILGFIGLAGYLVWTWIQGNFSPWLLLFVIMAGTQFWARRTMSASQQDQSYYVVPIAERIILGLVYFGLAAVLVFGMTLSHSLIFSFVQPQ